MNHIDLSSIIESNVSSYVADSYILFRLYLFYFLQFPEENNVKVKQHCSACTSKHILKMY